MQRTLDQENLRQDMVSSACFVRSHELSNGKLGATGFCCGGGTTNFLATELGDELNAGAPFYGSAAATDKAPRIKAAMPMRYAGEDERVKAMREDYEKELQAKNLTYEMHTYAGTRNGFHNYSTPRPASCMTGLGSHG